MVFLKPAKGKGIKKFDLKEGVGFFQREGGMLVYFMNFPAICFAKKTQCVSSSVCKKWLRIKVGMIANLAI